LDHLAYDNENNLSDNLFELKLGRHALPCRALASCHQNNISLFYFASSLTPKNSTPWFAALFDLLVKKHHGVEGN
jgi:hypothetical protein